MADIFTKTTFYAEPDSTGKRVPTNVNYEVDEETEEPTPTPEPEPEVPPPTDPDSGSDEGGYIGDVGSDTVVTVAEAPLITRKAHNRDIFVQGGQAFSITYVIDSEGTLLPKGGYEDMTVSYSANGREMTLSWFCPYGEAGDSTYIGAEVWGYGKQDSDETVRTLWDRLHVNKTINDVVFCGKNRDHKTITAGAENLMIRKGMTLVVDDDYYNTREDWINFGFVRDSYGSVWANVQRGEVSGYLTESHTYDEYFETGETFQAALIKKHAVIMAASPLGAILDREGLYGGVNFYGNGKYSSVTEGNTGGPAVEGVKVLGFAIRNAVTAATFLRVQRCGMAYNSFVQDISYDDSLTVDFTGGGSCLFNRATAYTLFENNNVLGNSRMLCGNFFGGYGAYKSVWRGNIATSGCIMFDRHDNISQTYTNYGAHNIGFFNCWAIDSAFFAAGYQLPQGGNPKFNHTFAQTNGGNNNVTLDQVLALNDVRAGIESNTSGRFTGNNDVIQNSVIWNRVFISDSINTDEAGYLMKGSKTLNAKNVTLGRNPDFYNFNGTRLSMSSGMDDQESMLFASPTWGTLDDLSQREMITSYSTWGGNNGFISNYEPQSSSVSGAEYSVYERDQAQSVGFKYISRVEESSTLDSLNTGCKNIFPKVGRYGKYFGESGYDTRYDGIEAQYVNAISRMPWIEFRRERQLYSCNSKGVNYSGKVGWAVDGGNPIDYINRYGTTPEKPLNCPYIEDWYVVAGTAGKARLSWRPIAPIFRSSVAGYKILVDGVDLFPNTPYSKEKTSIELTGLNSGQRRFNIIVVDPTNGNSGLSRTIRATIL